jgi:hypothetical protein
VSLMSALRSLIFGQHDRRAQAIARVDESVERIERASEALQDTLKEEKGAEPIKEWIDDVREDRTRSQRKKPQRRSRARS